MSPDRQLAARPGWNPLLAALCLLCLTTVARAAAPTIKLMSAPLADPSQAWSSYQSRAQARGLSPTAHTVGVAALPTRAPELRKLARSLGALRYPTDQYAQRVFDYVRLNIETEFRFGLGKGARGAALDQSGTPFDQANLMVELLREGNVAANYQIGTITLNATEFGLWTGLIYNLQGTSSFTVDARAACTLLADGGIPATVNGASSCTSSGLSGPLSSVTLLDVWVVVNFNGSDHLYDPGYKRHILKSGMDVAAAMGCGSFTASTCGSSVNSAGAATATQGQTSGVNYIQNVSRSGIEGLVGGYAQSLQTHIQSSDRFAQLEDVAGGAVIDVNYSPSISGSLPYATAQSAALATWPDIPDLFRTQMTVQFLGVGSPAIFLDELFGQRLRVATLGPQNTWTRTSTLYVEGTAIATGPDSAATQGTPDIVTVSIDHPYAASASGSAALDGTYADETLNLYAGQDWRNSSRQYVYTASGITQTINDVWPNAITISWDLGRTGQGYQSLMAQLEVTNREALALLAPYWQVPEQHAGESAGILVQQTAATKVLEDVSHSKITSHHSIGVAYTVYRNSSNSAFFNMTSMVSVASTTSSATDRTAAFSAYSLTSATIEGSVPQQTENGWVAQSAVSLLWASNEDHEQILVLPASPGSNMSSTASSLLQGNGYDSSRIGLLNQFVSTGYQVILPVKSAPPCLPLSGGTFCEVAGGEIVSAANELAYSVAERTKGDASTPQQDPESSTIKAAQLQSYSLRDRHAYSLDPASGILRLTPAADLQVGTGDYPASLYFKRTYSSDENPQSSCNFILTGDNSYTICQPMNAGTFRTTLGYGWKHNFEISAEWTNNGLEGLGLTSGLRAATTMATLYTAFDLARAPSLSQSIASAIVGHYLSGALMKNSILIHLPDKTLTFVKLPNGSYDAPINEPSAQLSINGAPTGPYATTAGIEMAYDGVTLKYVNASGDIMNFGYNYAWLTGIGSNYTTGPANFEILDWTTAAGVKVQFTYSSSGSTAAGSRNQHFLTRVSNNLGHSIILNGGAASETITSITDETGSRQVSYNITPSCQLASYFRGTSIDTLFLDEDCRGIYSVLQADGQTTSYSYMSDADSPDPVTVAPTMRLRKWFTPSSSTVPYLTVVYDEEMHVQMLVDAQGLVTLNNTAAIADEVDRLGETRDPMGAPSRSYYDRYNNPLIEIDPLSRVTAHVYDDARRVTQTIYPEGNGASYGYDVRSNLLSTTRFSKPGSLLPNIVGPQTTYYEGPTIATCANSINCNRPRTVKDANLNLTTYTYSDTTGQLLSILGAPLSNGISGSPLTVYCYTATPTTNFDQTPSKSLSLQTATIEQVTLSSSRVRTYSYNNAAGHYALANATIDPILANAGAAALTCPAFPSTTALTTSFFYDAVGNLQAQNGPRTDVTDITSLLFDKMRRLTRIVAPAISVSGSAISPITRYTYDVDGELLTTRHSLVASPTEADPTSPWPTLDGSQWQTETRTYWYTGDLQSVEDANGRSTHYDYDADGRLVMTTDPEGRRTATVYDAAGESICVWRGWNFTNAPFTCAWDPASYSDGSPLRFGAYTYAANGKQLTVTDANGNVTEYAYDGLDRLAFTLFPDPDNRSLCSLPTLVTMSAVPTCSGRQTYEQNTYDSEDNRIGLRTRKGDLITTTFNPLSLPDTKTTPDLPAVSYTYFLTGDSMSVTQGGHVTSYEYDGAGRKHSETNDGRPVTYGYDQAGNRATTLWPDSYQISYLYNALSQMQDVHEGSMSGAALAHYDYDILKRRKTLTYPVGSSSVGYTYEPNDSLGSMTHQMTGASLGLTYAHNGARQVTNITVTDGFYLPDPTAAATTGFTVNGLNEYTAVGPFAGTDSNGKPVVTGAHGRFISIPFDDLSIVIPMVASGRSPVDNTSDPGGSTVVYDVNGNLRRWTGTGGRNTYTYDSENRLRTAATSLHSVSYDYDPLGRRISKTVDGVQTGYLLDGDEEISEYNISSGAWPATPARRYVTGPAIDERIASVDAANSNAKTYYHVDHNGSVLATTNASGAVSQRFSYDEYGNLGVNSPSTTGEVFRYTGRRLDFETGLYYYRARYYSPQLGRFLQADPIGYQDDLDSYAYVGNDPLNRTDPTGEFCILGVIGTTCTPDPPKPPTVAAVAIATPEIVSEIVVTATRAAAVSFATAGIIVVGALFPSSTASDDTCDTGKCNITGPMLEEQHENNARPSTKEKHENGQARKARDKGGEKGDKRRDPRGKRPDGHKGQWPPPKPKIE